MSAGGFGPPGGGGGGGYPPGYGQGYAPPQGGAGSAGGYGQPAPGQPAGWGGQQPQQPQQPGGWGQPQQPGYGPPPGGFGAPMGAPQAGMGAELKFEFALEGGELFKTYFVGMLLTMITFGIYTPWFICKLLNVLLSKTTLVGGPKGTVRFSFSGEGGALFGKYLVGMLLTGITFGIYMSWFMCNMTKWFTENVQARADDGTTYAIQFNGEGASLFGTLFVANMLTMVTFGIYRFWAICKIRKWFMNNMKITENGQPVGTLDFVGEGSTLFGKMFVGMMLVGVTFGIYASWFACDMERFINQNTRCNWKGRNYQGDFNGQGGDLFVLKLINGLLIGVTFGIYMSWAMVKELKWKAANTVIKPV